MQSTPLPFWLMMVSDAMVVLPVWRSPMISSRWPRPMGIMESMALMPVCSGSLTGWRSMMPGAGLSMGRNSVVSMGPAPSMGWPSALTTRPISASPTGTDTTLPVRLTVLPSLIPTSEPSRTMETVFSSRFWAMPYSPFSNWSSSPAMHFSRPLARAMPSPTRMTVPTSLCSMTFS